MNLIFHIHVLSIQRTSAYHTLLLSIDFNSLEWSVGRSVKPLMLLVDPYQENMEWFVCKDSSLSLIFKLCESFIARWSYLEHWHNCIVFFLNSFPLIVRRPFRFQLINFPKKYFKKLAYIYYDKCLLWRYVVLRLTEKHTTLAFLFSIARMYLNYFMTHQLNIIFDDFGIWLQGYVIEFSCLYISHGKVLCGSEVPICIYFYF